MVLFYKNAVSLQIETHAPPLITMSMNQKGSYWSEKLHLIYNLPRIIWLPFSERLPTSNLFHLWPHPAVVMAAVRDVIAVITLNNMYITVIRWEVNCWKSAKTRFSRGVKSESRSMTFTLWHKSEKMKPVYLTYQSTYLMNVKTKWCMWCIRFPRADFMDHSDSTNANFSVMEAPFMVHNCN